MGMSCIWAVGFAIGSILEKGSFPFFSYLLQKGQKVNKKGRNCVKRPYRKSSKHTSESSLLLKSIGKKKKSLVVDQTANPYTSLQ